VGAAQLPDARPVRLGADLHPVVRPSPGPAALHRYLLLHAYITPHDDNRKPEGKALISSRFAAVERCASPLNAPGLWAACGAGC